MPLEFMNNQLIVSILLAVLGVVLIGLVIYLIINKRRNSALEEDDDEVHFYKVNDEKEEESLTEEQIAAKAELDSVLAKMEAELETKQDDVVRTFEDAQEEKSVISYQELLKVNNNETVTRMNLLDIDSIYEDDNEKEVADVLADLEEKPVETEKKFRNSEFISPVFGRVKSEVTYPKIPNFKNVDLTEKTAESINLLEIEALEKTLDIAPITEELRKNEEFLQSLKEFRRSLD